MTEKTSILKVNERKKNKYKVFLVNVNAIIAQRESL